MTWRGLVVAVLLAAVGVAGGVAVARGTAQQPVPVEEAVPVTGSPSVPTSAPVEVLPDPRTPPLAVDARTHRETIGQPPFSLTLPVPNGWTRTNSTANVWTWTVPANPDNTYLMRVTLGGFQSVSGALEARIAALSSATAIKEFEVEEQTSDTFTATYVLDSYRRVTTVRFLARAGGQTVFAMVELVGREADLPGMEALRDRISAESVQ